MRERAIIVFLLCAIFCAPSVAPSHASTTSDDGYLRQKVAILIFATPSESDLPEDADWILAREIRAFEAFVWRYSRKKLLVETVAIRTGRRLDKDEFLDRGPHRGALPRTSVVSDLEEAGWSRSDFDAVFVLYEPPPRIEPRVTGATPGPRFSVIPLTPATFGEDGWRYPLHLLMAREYLHQIGDAFAEATGGSYLSDPDEVDLRRALQLNSENSAIDWRLLDPVFGSWIPADRTP